MRAGLLLAFLAPAALACELPGGAAQQVKSAAATVLYRTPALKVGEHFAVEFAEIGRASCRERVSNCV